MNHPSHPPLQSLTHLDARAVDNGVTAIIVGRECSKKPHQTHLLARIGPFTSWSSISSDTGSPFCRISTSLSERIFHSISRIVGIKTRQSEALAACNSSCVSARATSEGQMVLGWARAERRRSRCGLRMD